MSLKLPYLAILGGMTGLLATTALAQTAPDLPAASVVTKVIECRTIADGAARLACFDASVATLDEAQKASEVVVVTREEVREARRGLFGFSLPRLRLFGGGKDDENDIDKDIPESITSTIASYRNGTRGVVFSLPDGAMWEQTDGVFVSRIRDGSSVEIKTGALGSFWAKVDGSRAIRVRRVK